MGRLSDAAFGGKTYEPARDFRRLSGQLGDVFHLMKDGQWRTLHQISLCCGGSEASCSSRLRDLRKAKYGSHIVLRKSLGNGLFEYRLVVNEKA
jgi:hypothetical protein